MTSEITSTASQSTAPDSLAAARDRLIVALDVDSAARAREVVAELNGAVGAFKIGMQLFTSAGPGIVREFADRGIRVFLDLKFHDIPNTVAKAGVEAARLGVWMFNVHASGGSEMMRRTVAEVAEDCERSGGARPLIIAVTVLTSMSDEMLGEVGVGGDAAAQVVRLAKLAAGSGLDGVVCSPLESPLIRSAITGRGFTIVTPGVRPETATLHDQKRVMTPGAAILNGSDYVVVGRPITSAHDMAAAAGSIVNEIAAGLG